jgi:hypothetical protein
MHEFENKWVAKWVPRKCMKRKGGRLNVEEKRGKA